MSRRAAAVLGGLVLAAGAAVRLFRLDHFSFGLDEVIQGFWIRGSWDFFWKSLRLAAVHPPLDYLVARAVEQLDPQAWQRKLPAVLWGVATVAALGALVARRAGRAAGLVTALLLAFAPFHVRYSQEFRPYSLGLLLLCLSLLALDCFLERPGIGRLVLLYLATLATAYTLYLAALVLALAAMAMLAEDAFSQDAGRRQAARRLLAWSPVFIAALWLAYLPWWPVVLEAARQPPMAARPPLSFGRAERILSFFAFAGEGGQRLGMPGLLFLGLALCGTWMALRRRQIRFLAIWAWGGLAAIEVLGQIHPYFDFARRYLPAGVALVPVAAVPLAELGMSRSRRAVAVLVAAVVLALDARFLVVYFREGRADWRPLARFLATRPAEERIFTENQYSQLCVAYYVCGPDWMYRKGEGYRPVWSMDDDLVRLMSAWPPGSTGWLIFGGQPAHEPLRSWAQAFPATPFPSAEGAVLHQLDPALREAAFGLKR